MCRFFVFNAVKKSEKIGGIFMKIFNKIIFFPVIFVLALGQVTQMKAQQADQQKFEQIKEIYNKRLALGGRYMENKDCKILTAPPEDNQGLKEILQPYFDYLEEHTLKNKFKIQDCTYPEKPKANELVGRVIMLNVGGEQIARWTIFACRPKLDDICLNAVMANIWFANNAQFPITGTVAESSVSSKNCEFKDIVEKGVPSLYAFRDGVTVRIKSFRPSDPLGASCTTVQPEDNTLLEKRLQNVLSEPSIKTPPDKYGNGNKIRVANLAAQKSTHEGYLKFARDSYLEALGKDEYKLLKVWVTQFRGTEEFTRFNNKKLGEPLFSKEEFKLMK